MARLLLCHQCQTLTKTDDAPATGPDFIGEDWIQRHRHGFAAEDFWIGHYPDRPHKGGMQIALEGDDIDFDEESVIKEIRGELAKNHIDIGEMRDELKEDALKCFNRHGNPDWPGDKCPDYHSDSKRIGITKVPKEHQMYLCFACPYQETVDVAKRWKAGLYE